MGYVFVLIVSAASSSSPVPVQEGLPEALRGVTGLEHVNNLSLSQCIERHTRVPFGEGTSDKLRLMLPIVMKKEE